MSRRRREDLSAAGAASHRQTSCGPPNDALLTLVAIPEFDERVLAPAPGAGALRVMLEESAPAWRGFVDQLAAERHVTRAFVDGAAMWVAAERGLTFTQVFPSARFEQSLAPVEAVSPAADDALLALVSGWLLQAGPTTAHELSELLRLPTPDTDRALLRLEASGAILRGRFTESTVGVGSRTLAATFFPTPDM